MTNKATLALLEKAFQADLDAAILGYPGVMQTRSKLVSKLVADGLLEHREETLGGRFPVVVRGYGLTILGNLTYCMSLKDEGKTT